MRQVSDNPDKHTWPTLPWPTDAEVLGEVKWAARTFGYLHELADGLKARAGIGWWIDFYNERRPHSSLVDRTPNEAYTVGATPGPGRYPAPSQPEAA